MAFYSPAWGYYAHCPKSGGIAFRKHLVRTHGPGMEVGNFHDIPFDTEGYPILTTIRHPVDWMASVYFYRRFQEWVEKKDGFGWVQIVNLTQHMKHLNWHDFVVAVCDRGIDIPYVTFSTFVSRADYVYKIEELDIAHANPTPNKGKMTDWEREKLTECFGASIEAFGYG
jgi:hypothetical protein